MLFKFAGSIVFWWSNEGLRRLPRILTKQDVIFIHSIGLIYFIIITVEFNKNKTKIIQMQIFTKKKLCKDLKVSIRTKHQFFESFNELRSLHRIIVSCHFSFVMSTYHSRFYLLPHRWHFCIFVFHTASHFRFCLKFIID